MANQEQLAILMQGVEVWNKWRVENRSLEIVLDGADLREADLGGANLIAAGLDGANLRGANLHESDLRGANLREGYLGEANLSGANLSGADLSEDYLVGANLREGYLSEANLSGANLSAANLNAADLSGADLGGANLSGADLDAADLSGADLGGANLSAANLNAANLYRANLSGADLSDANLCVTDLREANFNKANLNKADFNKAIAGGTVFGDVDFSETIGLDDVRHDSPSTIGTNTLRQSKRKIPVVFLRGCGLSDFEIESANFYDPDLSNQEINDILYKIYDLRARQSIQISPLFISYSHADAAFVDRLEVCLNEKGIRFWRDIHDAKAGRLEKQIEQAIRHNPTVLVVLSKNSTRSDWVEHEVRTARGLEKELKRDVLCPVALDESWKSSPWPERVMEQIMEYNILDFSKWQDEQVFGQMFVKLLDGLQLFYKK
jgi:uncharacterized protein YjbI with pentapeptide repeats